MADETIRIKAILDDKVSSKLSGMKTMLAATFGALTLSMIANTTVKLAALSSAAEETKNKFNEIFKGTEKVTDRIKKLSIETKYANSSLQTMASNIGALIKPTGLSAEKTYQLSERLVKLALDLASFHNLEPAQIIQDFQSALAGSSETLQKYGIDAKETTLAQKAFTMGLISSQKAYQKLDPEEKRQIRTLALIEKAYDDSESAIGDLSRTSDTYANQVRALNENFKQMGETIGNWLLPPLTKATDLLNTFLEKIRTYNEGRSKEVKPFFKELEIPVGYTQEGKPIFEQKIEDVKLPELNKKIADSKKEITTVNKELVISEDDLKKAFISELEWIEKTNQKNRDAAELRQEYQVERLKEINEAKKELYDEANQALKTQHENEYAAMIERADAMQYLANEEIKIEEEKAKRLAEIEQQKRREYQESFAILFDNLRVWGEESKTAFELYKAYASAETLISAFKSSQKIFEAVASQVWLGPLALPAAAAASGIAMAAGLARASAIANQDYKGRAIGGDVAAGQPYIVGERGREMFIPDMGGYIIPNNVLKKLGSGKSTVINISAIDAQSFKSFLRNGGATVLESEMSKGRLF